MCLTSDDGTRRWMMQTTCKVLLGRETDLRALSRFRFVEEEEQTVIDGRLHTQEYSSYS